ncbi:MAG: zinc-ribbon domain-containing protein [Actinobacteria bacterium]|nr:MAG: zinc-ribbon domain-containing protein [Actinomycetota bacterium]
MQVCPACGQENPERSRFCGMCGAALAPVAAPPREERKVVTILFTDLVGSTARAEDLDPEDVSATLSAYYAQLRAELERFGGTVEKFIGDAVMAVFGAPIAHEDDAERAVRAALAIRDSIGEELQIRTAVNTGEALVALGAKPGEGDAMVAGDVVNTAARLQGAAPVNGILVGEGTYRSTRQAIDYREAPPVEAKGKAEPVKVWEALGARSRFGSDVEEKLRTPLVGRERERDLLADALAHARAEQSAQLVTLVGVPGIGKSRLVAELFQITDADEEIISWRQGRSLPYGERVSFWALGEIVKAHAGILESDDAATAEEKLEGMVEALAEDEREREWLVRHTRPLVGLEGAERTEREEAFAAWRRLLEAAAEQRPLVLVFEDLHWADDGLLDFVDHLAEWATTVPLLIVATARPELLDRRPGWSGGKRNAFTLSIGALSDEETAQLLQRLLDRAVLDADAQQAVLQRAEGNPLYAEEYARMLVEHEDGDLALPETVQGLIAARVDGLAPEEKALLQEASVIGKVFWPGALPGSDEHVLHALERKEFVRRDRRSSMAGETQYAFLHALVRDVSYGQIPRAERAEKHRRAAEWLGSLAGDRAEDHAEMLAHHYHEALRLSAVAGLDTTALRGPARQAFADGAQRALSLNASAAAYELAMEAVELTEPGDPERATLQFLAAYGGRDLADVDTRDLLEEACEGFLALDDIARAAEACQALARESLHRGDTARSLEAGQRAHDLARSVPLSVASARALGGRARHLDILEGLTVEAIALAREVLAFADASGDDRLAMNALGTIGLARVHSGDPGGIDDLEQSLVRGESIGAVSEVSTTLNNLANCLWEVGRLDDSTARYTEAREVSERYGLTAGISWLDGEHVYECDRRGDLEGAIAAADHFLSRGDAATSYQTRPVLATRARVLLERGQVDEALADAEQALASFRESGFDAQVASEILTVTSRCLRAAGRHEEADSLLVEALSVPERVIYDLPLYLVELGRADDYLGLTEAKPGYAWGEAGDAAAAGNLVRASEIYASIGARFVEAWAALLAAERGDTSRLDAALAYFEEQRATPYVQRCRALLQASA